MSEVEWSEETDEAPPKKSGVPKWVWFGGGCGCLAAIVVAIVAVVLMVRWIQDASDPEKQWPRLEKSLPFDERPENLQMAFGTPIPGLFDQFILFSSEGDYIAKIMIFKTSTVDELDKMFEESNQGAPFGLGAPKDPELGTIEIQEKTVRCLRHSGLKAAADAPGPGIRVDISDPQGRAGFVDLLRQHAEADPFTDEEVQAFFENFDVWRKR